MAITGTIPLSKMQGALETTAGTARNATRVLPILSGALNQHIELAKHEEQRASMVRHYRAPIQKKQYVEISGMEIAPTFEDLPWYLQLATRGNATRGSSLAPSLDSVTGYTYGFYGQAGGVNQSATLEVGNATQAWKVTHAVINRLEFGWSVGGPCTLTVDWLGARAVAGSFTGALSAVTSEDIAGGPTGWRLVYIDSSTIGSTLSLAVQDFKFSIDNHLVPHWAPTGVIYPTTFYHSEPRTMRVEAAIAYTSNTEYAAFVAGTIRKIYLSIAGSAVAGSSPTFYREVILNWRGYWDEAPWSDQDGLVVQRFVGDAVNESGVGFDWAVFVRNALSTIT